MSKETTKGPNSVATVAMATVAVATGTKEGISNGYDERVLFNGRGTAKAGHEESDVICVGASVSADTLLRSQMVSTDALPMARLETRGAHPGDESYPLRNGNPSKSILSVESHRASSDGAELVSSQMLPSQTSPQTLPSQMLSPQTLSSHTSQQTLPPQTLPSQTLSCHEGKCQNVRETNVLVQDKNLSSCSQSLSPTKACNRISEPRTGFNNDDCCQPVVTLHCATNTSNATSFATGSLVALDSHHVSDLHRSTQPVVTLHCATSNATAGATGTSVALDNQRVTDLHSSTSLVSTNISCTISSGGNTTSFVSQANVPTYATCILSKDTNCLTTSTSAASQAVMATFSAGIQCKENCSKVGIDGTSVPVICSNSTLVVPDLKVGSTSTVTSMQSSCEVSSYDATFSSATEQSVDKVNKGCLEKMVPSEFGTMVAGEISSLKVGDAEKHAIQNFGSLNLGLSDVLVKNKDLCPEALDHETRSCTELSKNSESLKEPLVLERTKAGEISADGSSTEMGAEADVDARRLEDPLASDRRYDRRSVTSISSDSRLEMRCELPPSCIVASQSTEKIVTRPNPNNSSARFFAGGSGGGRIVRGSRSQENYFDSGDIMCVDIDLDDIASSVDALHYDTSSLASLDSMSTADWPMDESESEICPEEIESPRSISSDACFSSPAPDPTASVKFVPSAPISKAKTSRPCDESRAGTAHGIALSVSAVEIENAFNDPNCAGLGDASAAASNLSKDGFKQQVIAPVNATSTSAVTPTSNSASATKDPAVFDSRTKISEPAAATAVSAGTSGDRNERDEEREGVGGGNQDFDFIFRDESFFRQPSKDVDRPSAARLAKRLFFLHGFRRSDVSRHLSKRNSFSQLVGEEYLKYFDFTGEPLDGALRQFMKHVTVFGESQDRERLLVHFSARYQQCNPETFKSEACCHTLSCALLLLNNDLNGQNIGRKITAVEFISNMADMNDGEQFPREQLDGFYTSIKNHPLEFEAEEAHDSIVGSSVSGSPTSSQSMAQTQGRFISYNPFYEIPDTCNTVEYKKGYIMRKCCLEPDGRKTPLGKRGWKMFYATLRDMVLHLHIDEHGFKRNQQYTSATNSVLIHHSLATKATDYQKKNHVFRLQTADLAQYLVQTSDTKECQEWIDAINFVAASCSAPQLSSSISSQKRFQRPLLPSTHTRLNLREQIGHHEKMIAEFDRELVEHRKNPPEKGAKTRLIQDYCKKENYLKFELKRYKTYCRLLQYKVSTFPELEPSLAETVIGEVEEPSSSPPVDPPFGDHCPNFLPASAVDVPPQSGRQFQT